MTVSILNLTGIHLETRVKIFAGCFLVIIGLIGWAFYQHYITVLDQTEAFNQLHIEQENLNRLHGELNHTTISIQTLLNFAPNASPEDLLEYHQNIIDQKAAIEALDTLDDNALHSQNLNRIFAITLDLAESSILNNLFEARQHQDQLNQALTDLNALIFQEKQKLIEKQDRITAHFNNKHYQLNLIFLAVTVAIFMMAALTFYLLQRAIVRPVRALSEALETITADRVWKNETKANMPELDIQKRTVIFVCLKMSPKIFSCKKNFKKRSPRPKNPAQPNQHSLPI